MSDNPWFELRPQPASGPSESGSPDIILGGLKPDPRYTADYDDAFNATGNFGATNYVYVRAKNAAADQSIGNVMVYAVRHDSVQNQAGWVGLKTAAGGSSSTLVADGGEVGVNGKPLVWNPGVAPPPAAPWLLIAEVVGDDYPQVKLPLTVTDFASFESWAADQSRIACLVVQLPNVKPVAIPSFTWSRMVELDNADAITLDVSVTCISGSAGGSLAYRFDKNDSDDKPIGIGTTAYQVNAVYSQSRTVPANFASTLSLTYTPAADETAQAEFTVQVASETSDGDSGDLGDTTRTLFINDTLDLGQTRGQLG